MQLYTRLGKTATIESPRSLSPGHTRMLLEESGISPGVAAERGYFTAERRADVPAVFPEKQKRSGALVLPMFSPDGSSRSYQIRPDKPFRKPDGSTYRYASPTGAKAIVDVHPRNLEAVSDPSVPLWITEGVKKGDALTSRGLCALTLAGVWMFRKKKSGEMLDCFDHVALRKREVHAVYDSDVMVNPSVQGALSRIVSDLEDRGARVEVVYLPDAEDGSKQGVDDFFAAGGTVEDLYALARPFSPVDLGAERVSRDTRLSRRISALWEGWQRGEWKGIGGYNRREVLRQIIHAAEQHGKTTGRGTEAAISQRTIAERSGIRQATVSKAVARLEEDGYLVKLPSGAPDQPIRYLLPNVTRAYQEGESQDNKRKKGCLREDALPSRPPCGDTPLSHWELERLRGNSLRRDRTPKGYEYQVVERIGKIAGHALECLVAVGGRASAPDLIRAMGRDDRPCRFKERHLSKLEAAEIVRLEGDDVVLNDDWRLKLLADRERSGEYEAERLQRDAHKRAREAFRLRKKTPVANHPANRGADGFVEELEELPEPVPMEDLYRKLSNGESVETPDGLGTLWQVFTDRVGVVLSAAPDRVEFYPRSSISLERKTA